MDQGSTAADRDSVVVTGLGDAVSTPCDPAPYLRNQKLRKFMGTQDDLAVVAAGRALESAGLLGTTPSERTGLYLAVGYIPFDAADMEELHALSLEDGRFSMRRFATEAYPAADRLLTFRCLPNMPAFHISVNFDVQGPYFVTYPGVGQFYLAVEAAAAALADDTIDVALVGGIAHQRNFLVAHHFNRLDPPVSAERLADSAGCLVLETQAKAALRAAPIRGRLRELELVYEPYDPFRDPPSAGEWLDGAPIADNEHGAASLAVALARSSPGLYRHHAVTRDGIEATSVWELR
jgi:Beta-ketoacyl synthase, N-terminal domain